MGFVILEDLQGTVELIVFPRLWKKLEHKLERDQIILVDGRVDTGGLEPKILVSSININEEINLPRADKVQINKLPNITFEEASDSIEENCPVTDQNIKFETGEEVKNQPREGFDLHQPVSVPDEVPLSASGLSESQAESIPSESDLVEKETAQELINEEVKNLLPINKQANLEIEHTDPISLPLGGLAVPSFILPPTPSEDTGKKVNMMTVIVRCSGDKARDELKIRRLYGLLTSYPGNDRFAFHVFENGRGFLLEFPNCTVGICSELKTRISQLVNPENIRIDSIYFQ